MKKLTYAAAGVNIAKVREMQKKINALIFSTANKYTIPIRGHYAGFFKVGSHTLAIHADGVGTKVIVAQELEKYDTIGIDAIAMNVNDMLCIGASPIVCVDYLALGKEDSFLVSEIMKGLVKGAKESGCALIGGETAILPEIIKGGRRPFDLAVTAVGLVEGKRMLTGSALKSGDVIVGLASSGLHSNGYTLARKVLPIRRWGKEMLIPTRIYVKPVLEMLKKCSIHGIAHITGGAFSKLIRVGKYAKKGFLLDNMPKLTPIFSELRAHMESDREFYRTFNAGIGMCIMCPEEESEKIMGIGKKYKIGARIIGKVIEREDVILEKEGKRISLL